MFLGVKKHAIYYGKGGVPVFLFAIFLFMFCSGVFAVVGPNDVLILVNNNSPTSHYIAKLYREYYPSITDRQVFVLTDGNLADCSGPSSTAADEIISRELYENAIAIPLRAYLVNNDMADTVKVIITTAGLPYRIADSTFTNVVIPGGSVPYAGSLIGSVEAASVESELTLLFQNDFSSGVSAGFWDRVVNVYQGYRNSGIDLFSRNIVDHALLLNWRYPRKVAPSHYPPLMEGDYLTSYGVKSRHFSAGDMYLTCRLDGPKKQGQTAVFAVRQMLERAKRASSAVYGVNPASSAVVFDDSPWASDYNYNRIYNLNRYVNYIIWQSGTAQPPDTINAETRDDYDSGYKQLTGQTATGGVFNSKPMTTGHGLTVISDKRAAHRTNQGDLSSEEMVVGVTSFGRNGDEGSASDYLGRGGPGGGALFNVAYGAVFYSIESFNAVTMFSDVETGSVAQGKIVDFIEIGGSGAIGHAFEPYSDASVDTEFLFYNLLSDADNDGYADMTYVEAAWTSIPYLSWSEIVIGDPLMRIAYGPGGAGLETRQVVGGESESLMGMINLMQFTAAYLSQISGDVDNNYNDLCDIDQNGMIDFRDYAAFFRDQQ